MFKFLVIAGLLGVTFAAPQFGHVQHHDDIQIKSLASQVNEDGTYGYNWELTNGATAQESGVGGQYANGGFRYISPEGETVELRYTADADGFHPQGSHLPTPPPIPEEILKAIELIRTNPTPEEVADRQIRLKYNQ